MKRGLIICALAIGVLGGAHDVDAETVLVEMRRVTADGAGAAVGTVRIEDARGGLLIVPALRNLTAGMHGFHVHQNGNCGPSESDGKNVPGGAAGGHFDPGNTGKHLGPYGDGHLGDLPVLWADRAGESRTPLFAPRLSVARVKGKALMIHAGGDNYSDTPKRLGGGGARFACGVIDAG